MTTKVSFWQAGLFTALLLPLANIAQASDEMIEEADNEHIEEVHVFGHAQSVALPQKTVSEEELAKAQAGNLSKLLETMPGISNASFGEGVGRPVIRGMSANRVKLSVNGAANADVSSMSADHAPVMDMANAQSVEVIYGPNTLRFGSGAMGGLVNLNDNRFHDEVFSGVQGHVKSSYGSNANSVEVAASLDFAGANSAMSKAHIGHVDVYYRESDNFTAGIKSGESLEVDSSSTEAVGASTSYNFVAQDAGSVGVAVGYTRYEYGIPNADKSDTKVTPEQMRVDVQGSLKNITPIFEQWEASLSVIGYQHEELINGKAEALFEKAVVELNTSFLLHTDTDWIISVGEQTKFETLALCHSHSGCEEIPDYGDLLWDGQVGANLIIDTRSGFRFNHSTPMPLTQTFDAGVFLIVGKELENLMLEFGARADSRTISTDPDSIDPTYRRKESDYDDITFTPISASVGLNWDLDRHRVAVNLAHSQRAPTVEEMYYNGDHHATFSYQLDNIELDIESANSLDLTWQLNLDAALIEAAVFYYDFGEYIYNDIKPVKDPYHGRDVYRYEQAGAWFTGGELSVDVPVTIAWSWFGSVDVVRAQLKQGENKNLPRTPPASVRTGVAWVQGAWALETDVHYFLKQTDVAENESESVAFSTWNAFASYTLDFADSALAFQLKARNLLDAYGVNHVSYLKDYSPVQGRNIEAGLVYRF